MAVRHNGEVPQWDAGYKAMAFPDLMEDKNSTLPNVDWPTDHSLMQFVIEPFQEKPSEEKRLKRTQMVSLRLLDEFSSESDEDLPLQQEGDSQVDGPLVQWPIMGGFFRI